MWKVMTEWTCDRCGRKEYTNAPPISITEIPGVKLSILPANAGLRPYKPGKPPVGWKQKHDLVLCPECAEQFVRFMAMPQATGGDTQSA